MRKIKFIILISCLPFFAYSQQWQQYADTLTKITQVNQNKSDLERALKYIKLIDNDISKSKLSKDTIYAEYLYRKGFVLYRVGELRPDLFEESHLIWQQSTKKDFFKLMKINYFLAEVYNVKKDFTNAYKNYENCYLLNKKHKLKENTFFTSSVYCLSVIDYNNMNYKSAERYANEYIELKKESAFTDFDFNYAYAYKWIDDSLGYENVLLEFNKKYENEKLNNIETYIKINFLLFEHYYSKNKLSEIIKYGEKALDIYQNSTINNEQYLKNIYPRVLWAYREIGDNVNIEKYETLLKK